MFKKSLAKFLVLCSFSFSYLLLSSQLLAMEGLNSFDKDPRYLLISSVKERYAEAIATRQALLRTDHSAVALVDIAREYLAQTISTPSDYDPLSPDWSSVIRHIVSGYGDKGGVDTAAVISEDEQSILSCGFALSSAYEVVKGKDGLLNPDDIYSQFGNKSSILAYVETFNSIASQVPDEIYDFANENVARLSLGHLRTFNAWFAHERFWAVAGVLDPKTSDDLRNAFGGYNGKISDIDFVNDLAKKLDLAITSASNHPNPEEVVELIKCSQQILLTLSAGLPIEDGAFIRLAPKNPEEWQVIRKALFLALSVTSNPESCGRTFLSTLYNCGEYFHKKTDPDHVKEYYWQLEAFAKGFSTVWSGLKGGQLESTIQSQLIEVIAKSDPSYGYKRANNERGSSYVILNKAYETAIKSTTVKDACKELATAFILHPKLKHEETFRELYPDLTLWTTYHSPSLMAKDLVSGDLTPLNLSKDFQPQGVQLIYQGGKWILKALQLDAKGNATGEAILWSQGVNATETFVGELANSQGLHLFSFGVNGATATIKAISSGYHTKVGGDGATVTVAHGNEIGVIESSAYPLHTDIFTNSVDDAAIGIMAKAYMGMRGILAAQHDSVWVKASEIINCWNYQGFEVRYAGGAAYNFFPPQEHGARANKDVIFFSDDIHATFSTLLAGQDVCLLNNNNPTKYAVTHGSIIQAGHSLFISHGAWHGETRWLYAGLGDAEYKLPQRILTEEEANYYASRVAFESPMAMLEYGRSLFFSVGQLLTLNQAEKDVLFSGSHVYGLYDLMTERRRPTFSKIEWQPATTSSYSRGYGGGFGSFGSGFSSNNTGWGVGPKFAPMMVRSQPLTMSSMSYQGAEFSLSNRGGTTNIGGSINFSSMGNNMNFGNTTLGFGYSRGDGVGSMKLTSTYTPPSLMEQVRMGTLGIEPTKNNSVLDLHMLSGAAILQMTTPKQLNINMGGLIIQGGIETIKKAPQIIDKLRKVYQAGKLLESSTTSGILRTGNVLNETGEKDKEKCQEESKSNTLTGGQLPDPDDEDPKKKHTKLKDGDSISEHDALVEAEKFLGENYTQAAKGRYVSEDGARQFRMLDKDLAGHKGGPGHVHFEYLKPEPGQAPNIHLFLK